MRFLLIFALSVTFVFGVVDINNASVKELMKLNGIGKKKAEKIVAYRKRKCFKNIEDLTNVKGIGKKTVEKNRSDLKVGSCKR